MPLFFDFFEALEQELDELLSELVLLLELLELLLLSEPLLELLELLELPELLELLLLDEPEDDFLSTSPMFLFLASICESMVMYLGLAFSQVPIWARFISSYSGVS